MRKFLFYSIWLILFVLASCKESSVPEQPPHTVNVGHPLKKTLTEWDEYTGRFRAIDRVEIRARVSGYLDEIRFKDGQKINKGDVLFVIDQRPFILQVERADARFQLASKEYERAKSLGQTNLISRQETDKRLQELRDAKAALDEAKLNLEFTEIKAPIDGRVSRHLVDIGNLVTGGDANAVVLTTIVAENPIHFYFEASEQELLKYLQLDREGKRESSRTKPRSVYVRLQDEKEFIHEGRMDFIDNELDRETGTIQGRAIFDNPDEMLIPGIFGRLRIAGSGTYLATLVPDAVIGSNQTQKFVYVVNQENSIEMRPVVLGPLHDNNLRIIREGLKDNDRVVLDGLMYIQPGMKVVPQFAQDNSVTNAQVNRDSSK